jgi:hypothetical protein
MNEFTSCVNKYVEDHQQITSKRQHIEDDMIVSCSVRGRPNDGGFGAKTSACFYMIAVGCDSLILN